MSFIIGLLMGSAITTGLLYKLYKQRGANDYKRGYEACYDQLLEFRTNNREEYRKIFMSS